MLELGVAGIKQPTIHTAEWLTVEAANQRLSSTSNQPIRVIPIKSTISSANPGLAVIPWFDPTYRNFSSKLVLNCSNKAVFSERVSRLRVGQEKHA